MAVRLTDVASEAGVSLATASRVLNGSARKPAADISEKVRAAAKKLGYFPNAQAQALARSTTKLVGLVVRDIADPYFSTIARGVQRGLGEHGIQLLLASTGESLEVELEAIRAFMSQRTDAIILAGSRRESGNEELLSLVKSYQSNGGHVAMIGQPLPVTGGVRIDNRGASAKLAGQLLSQGFRRFVMLVGDADVIAAGHRFEGFASKLADAGIKPEAVMSSAFSREGGYLAMAEYLNGQWDSAAEGRICVFCSSDVMALGALRALRDRGLRVPQDFALTGFDDIPTLVDITPSLTTVHLPLDEIGRMAGEMVATGAEPTVVIVGGDPVLRESTENQD